MDESIQQQVFNLKQILLPESGTLLPFEIVNDGLISEFVDVCRTNEM